MNRKESVGQRRGDGQEHSHSRSSCWLHCHSSRHCPYRQGIQGNAAWPRAALWHRTRKRLRDRTWASPGSSTDGVNITKNRSEEESDRRRRKLESDVMHRRLLQNNSSKHKRHNDNRQTWDGASAEAKNSWQNCRFKNIGATTINVCSLH